MKNNVYAARTQSGVASSSAATTSKPLALSIECRIFQARYFFVAAVQLKHFRDFRPVSGESFLTHRISAAIVD